MSLIGRSCLAALIQAIKNANQGSRSSILQPTQPAQASGGIRKTCPG
ncbi:hypothetical protein PAMC26577_01290 [Caballeronia sordidicola]|uniref:Uncharacterized protein n=1 Tax=Caballeronia sordidicola TaxID=196367 RepID=A0A242N7B7_CABSO|nr:hypothetical protein PAMC26577_01290 [Caballeronia sordidicola]